jgi:peptidoglycan-associated lipoprotein
MTRSVWFAAAMSVAVLGGCKKKPPPPVEDHGKTDGITPDPNTDRLNNPLTPTTPPIRMDPINGGDNGSGPLKDVYFDFDQYNIRADQHATLAGNSDWLKSNQQNVLIEGHCDERGTEEYNLALGDRRANATREYLRNLGIPSGRLSTISYGKAYPVDPGHSEGAWARNRRAHFTLVSGKAGDTGR